MTEHPDDDGELLPEERARVAALTREDLAAIDAALLAQVSDEWRKLARVVGRCMMEMPNRPADVPDLFFAERVARLVDTGQLEAQGNLRCMRFSEVRRPAHLIPRAG